MRHLKMLLTAALLMFCLLPNAIRSQGMPPPFTCIHDTLPYGDLPDVTYMPYGGVFTPTGDIRALIIFVGFSDPGIYPIPALDSAHYSVDGWPAFDSLTFDVTLVPLAVEPSGRHLPIAYKDTTDFVTFAHDTNVMNVSKLWYQMSGGKFRFMADVYKDPTTGLPTRLNIDRGITSFSDAVTAAFDTMQAHDPSFDWSRYDSRTNRPGVSAYYSSDNSNTSSDHIIDYVILVFRVSRGIAPTDVPFSNNMYTGGGFSRIGTGPGSFTYNYGSYTISRAGFTLGNGAYYHDKFNIFTHEIAHELYTCPHYGDANGVIGKRWQSNRIWGNIEFAEMPFQTMNAWERWYTGWIDLETGPSQTPSDVQNADSLPPGGTFVIRDYATTGDVIRIRIPNTNSLHPQFLWLENHQILTQYDRPFFKKNGLDQYMGTANPGLVAFIEQTNTTGTRNENYNYINGVNGMKVLHPGGNKDFTRSTNHFCPYPPNWFFQRTYEWTTGAANPISGHNGFQNIRADLNDYGITGCPSVIPPNDTIIRGGTDQVGENEGARMIYRDSGYTYDFFGRDITFQVGDKLGVGTQVPVLNYPEFNNSQKRDGIYYLNGLSVEIISVTSGDMTVKVRFDDVELTEDLRWCGRIVLQDIVPGTANDLVLKSGNTLTLDLSGTPTGQYINAATGTFAGATEFNVKNNARFYTEPNSTIMIREHSKMVLESGSQLYLNGDIIIQQGGELEIQNGAEIIFGDGARITVLAQGKLTTLATSLGSGFTVPAYYGTKPHIDVHGTLTVNAPEWTNDYNGNLYYTFHPGHTLSLPHASAAVNLTGYASYEKLMEIYDTYLNFGEVPVSMEHCIIEYTDNSRIMLADSSASFNVVNFIGLSTSTAPTVGIYAERVPVLDINGCTFTGFSSAVQISNTARQTNLYMHTSDMSYCRSGINAINASLIDVVQSEITFCQNGIRISDATKLTVSGPLMSISDCDRGVSIVNVDSAIFDQALIEFNDYGIHSTTSNIWVRNGTRVRESTFDGIHTKGLPTTYSKLTIGDYGCGWVYLNGYNGIYAEDVLLDIDQITHATNNSGDTLPNRFDDNALGGSGTYGINLCYSYDPGFSTINARGNYWVSDGMGGGDVPPPGYIRVRKNCSSLSSALGMNTANEWTDCTPINCPGCSGTPLGRVEFESPLTWIREGDSTIFMNQSDDPAIFDAFDWALDKGAATFEVSAFEPGYVIYPAAGLYDASLTGTNETFTDQRRRKAYILVDNVEPYSLNAPAETYCQYDTETISLVSGIFRGNVVWGINVNGVDQEPINTEELEITFSSTGSYTVWVRIRRPGVDTVITFPEITVNNCMPDPRYASDNDAEDETTQDMQKETGCKLYPNPGREIVTIESKVPMQQVEVTTIDGRKIILPMPGKSVSVTTQQMDISTLPAGMYFVRIKHADESITVLPFVKL